MSRSVGGAESLRCPCTGQLYEEPLKNLECGHIYSKAGIERVFRNRTSRYARCPVAGCTNHYMTMSQLVEDEQMAFMVGRYKRRHASQANDDESTSRASQADESSNDEKVDRLDWRMDPEESFSDWTIEITCKQQDKTNGSKKQNTFSAVYHVHKAILAVGSRKSEYFARIFRSNRFQEAESNKSCIELHELALEPFPSMLDYLYQPSKPLNVTTETATALKYLGDYFIMNQLQRDAMEFVEGETSVVNCGTYYEHATALNDGRIMDLVENECMEMSGEIDPSEMIVTVAEPTFWLTVFQRDLQENSECYDASENNNNSFLKGVSRLVAEICHQHKDTMDAEMFRALTDVQFTPLMCPDAALRLLELETRFVSAGDAKLSSLQERCIEALVQNWKTVDFSKSNVLQVLETQRPTLLAHLLAKTVGRVKHD